MSGLALRPSLDCNKDKVGPLRQYISVFDLKIGAQSMSHEAGPDLGFGIRYGEQFSANLEDTMVGISSAPVSSEAKKLHAENIKC